MTDKELEEVLREVAMAAREARAVAPAAAAAVLEALALSLDRRADMARRGHGMTLDAGPAWSSRLNKPSR